jgi:NAD(P)-dependent dehydrogenase (short-subunit alcohol dehydrogenase family)
MNSKRLEAVDPELETRGPEPLLKDRVALIVGGGNGLGRSIARAYAREGALLGIADLSSKSAQETLDLAGRGAGGVSLALDVSDPAASEAAVGQMVKHFGRLEILVNCAAICLVDPILDVTPERWDRVFDINVRGTFFCMQAAARAMIPRGFGRILNVTSPASRMGFPLFASYGASKAAVESLTRAAAVAWAPHGVTVNSIVPGRMTGGMIEKLEEDLSKATGKSAEELRVGRTHGLPMGRRVSPDEVAEAAVWLASARAAYVTAERFNFTGGMELS